MEILQMFEEVERVWVNNWHTNTAVAMAQSGAWPDIRIEFKSNDEGQRKITFKLDKSLINRAEDFCRTKFDEKLDWKVIDKLMNVMVFRVMEMENAQLELEGYRLEQLAKAKRWNNDKGVLGAEYSSPKFLRRGAHTTTEKSISLRNYFR